MTKLQQEILNSIRGESQFSFLAQNLKMFSYSDSELAIIKKQIGLARDIKNEKRGRVASKKS